MTTPDRMAVAVEEAVAALRWRLANHGGGDLDELARGFIRDLQRQGWSPVRPVTALPSAGRAVPPPHGLLAETRARLREARPAAEDTPGRSRPATEGDYA
jgi:hypothetical protein